ncbi:MurR/RpiR family transcriptional regulator [Streptobacillus moniliformis]|uniref:MurR/RpiR family transcriptional regulator n=1 Tax=Streptobacillus moniliformis TaxID=34105 RepID=UPI0007E30F11|nr:MurR/RpiR family transcriptional regulator [Streptobacillus moniliformis]
MKYITLIQSFYPSFSKQEIKVADYVIKEKDAICFMPLHEITKKINLSEATIVRFVKKIGFKGFIDFKLEVAREIATIEDERNTKEHYIENIEYNIIETIKNTKNLINKEDVENAIEAIENSKKLYVFGMGASGVAALEFQNRFMRFGKIGHSVSDGHFQVMYASTTTEKDVIVVISLSGETVDLIYPLSIAKENGCKIIAITNYILSPIAKLSDIVILTSGKETLLNGGALVSKMSQLYIIDVLATGYALRNSKKAKLVRQGMAEAIANKNK